LFKKKGHLNEAVVTTGLSDVCVLQDDGIFSGKCTWTAAEEESLLDAMDSYSFGNWYYILLFTL